LIAEQHIALHFSSTPHNAEPPPPTSSYIGVIDTSLRPADIIRNCEHTVGEICELKYGVRPTVNIIGSPDTTIAHIPMHLEYILTELLKNSFRATIEAGMESEPIEVTIAPAPASEAQTADLKAKSSSPEPAAITNKDQGTLDAASSNSASMSSYSNIRPLAQQTPGVTIRIRDRGGGIDPAIHAKLWEYGFTTFDEDEILSKVSGGSSSSMTDGMPALDALSVGGAGGSSLAGLGYGLPLGRAYAEYFGGGIAVQSLWGWGTDVYLSLRGVGRVEV
jgi:signal transduction histidine kinase